jgi:hypothetical protein
MSCRANLMGSSRPRITDDLGPSHHPCTPAWGPVASGDAENLQVWPPLHDHETAACAIPTGVGLVARCPRRPSA